MSDDEEVIYKKPQKTIHYGSLENTERVKQQQKLEDIQSDDDDYEPESKKPASSLTSTVTAPNSTVTNQSIGNINISNEYFDLEQEMYKQNIIQTCNSKYLIFNHFIQFGFS